MKPLHWITGLALVLGFALTACTKKTEDLKQITSQQVGDQVIVLLNETGRLNPGENTFFLEARNASNNQLVDVGTVRLNVSMPMPGMAPMIAEATATPTSVPGRYKITSNFSMAGTWQMIVILADGKQVQFNLTI
jgi:hypothetical protein